MQNEKKVNILFGWFTALVLIIGFGTVLVCQGCDPLSAYGSLTAITLIASVVMSGSKHSSGVLTATIYRQVWTGEVLKKLRLVEVFSWVSAITKDYSQYVAKVGEEAEVINLASFPVEPDVLIDNNVYPIPTQDLPTDPLTLSLNKYQTKVTPITDDEVYANTTNKMKNVTDAHTSSIIKNKFAKGAWNICPTGNSAATPVLLATGPDDGTGRKTLVMKDIVRFKRALDNAGVSDAPGSRILVLSKDHENDLCDVDQKFADQYYNYQTGKPYNKANFTFYGYDETPYYNTTTLAKQSLGVTVTSAMRRCSMFFSTERVGKANGSTKAYLSPSEVNPGTQTATMNARHYHLITRLMNEGVGAIVSPDA